MPAAVANLGVRLAAGRHPARVTSGCANRIDREHLDMELVEQIEQSDELGLIGDHTDDAGVAVGTRADLEFRQGRHEFGAEPSPDDDLHDLRVHVSAPG